MSFEVGRETHVAQAPLYARVRNELESLAVGRALDDRSPLPSEAELSEMFDVSRGTLRRAVAELAADGLLRVEQGRGTYVDPEEQIRRRVWAQLLRLAHPDSRFDLDLSYFIPDFEGRERCDEQILALDAWHEAETIFIAPDNNLENLRRHALSEGRSIVVPTYGMRRGFVRLDGQQLDSGNHGLAATLDGMERLGHRVSLDGLKALRRINLLITGAVGVSTVNGAQVGLAQRYHAVESAIFSELGLLDETQVIVSAHDCQLLDIPLLPEQSRCQLIVTPTRLIHCQPEQQAASDRVVPLRDRPLTA
jgi:5-formyltetrahydrofolate cyclo-ligase